MTQTPPSRNRLPLPLALFMVFTCAVWCGIWIVVAEVTWPVLKLRPYRSYIEGGSVLLIALGAVLLLVAVNHVARGLRDHRQNQTQNKN
jgi:DMSO reductase anchor subunit